MVHGARGRSGGERFVPEDLRQFLGSLRHALVRADEGPIRFEIAVTGQADRLRPGRGLGVKISLSYSWRRAARPRTSAWIERVGQFHGVRQLANRIVGEAA